MLEAVVPVLVESDADGTLRVLAPRVGVWSDLPRPGELLGPGSPVGRLMRLRRRCRLVLADGPVGRVGDGLPVRRALPVEYGQLLFRLVSAGALADAPRATRAAGPTHADLPDGARAVVAPTDGVFYRCPTPDAPPFVEPGQHVRTGQPVGLVEVMKTFNQILYGGPGLPDQAEVLELRAGDGQEVRAGQVLIVVR